MLNKNKHYLLIIFVIAVALRIIGIFHGFPYIFHPDEPTIIRSALQIRFYKNPGHFDWPHLYIYLNYFLYMVFAKVRDLIVLLDLKEFVYFSAPIIWNDNLIFYLLTRGLTAVLGALTVFPVYLTAKEVFNEKTGLLSGLALALAPFHVWHSHYALADVPMVFFLAWSLYFSSKILFKKELVNYLFAGIFLGLAGSTKYNAALGVVFILFAHLIRILLEKNEKLISFESIENIFFAGMATVFGFAIGTPYAILDYTTFLIKDNAKGALWQFTNVGNVTLREQFTHFVNTVAGTVSGSVAENVGYSLMYLFLMSVVYVCYKLIKQKRNFAHKELLFFALTGLFLLFYVSGSEKTRAHYFLIAYPAVILGAVGFLSVVLAKYKLKFKWLIWAIILVFPAYLSLVNSYTFYQTDTRLILSRWIKDSISKSTKIYYSSDDLKLVMEDLNYNVEHVDSNFMPPSNSIYISGNDTRNEQTAKYVIHNKYRKGPQIYIY